MAEKQIDIKNALPKKCLETAIKIIVNKISFEEVDKTKSHMLEQRNLDSYWNKGIGDCDKYASFLIHVFNIIKKNNKNCKNVYVTKQTVGKTKPHAWNTAWIFDKDRVIISEIDLTSYDYNGRLEADSYHIEKNPDIMKMKIAEACNDYENALKYLDNFYYTKTGDNFRKLIYKKSMYSAFLFTDEFSGYSKKQKNEFAKKILKAHQEAVDMNSYFVRHYDIILENAIGAYYSLGNIKKAHNLAKNFESRFGKSPFSENSIWGNLRFGN